MAIMNFQLGHMHFATAYSCDNTIQFNKYIGKVQAGFRWLAIKNIVCIFCIKFRETFNNVSDY